MGSESDITPAAGQPAASQQVSWVKVCEGKHDGSSPDDPVLRAAAEAVGAAAAAAAAAVRDAAGQ
jgi:hypothetical protein